MSDLRKFLVKHRLYRKFVKNTINNCIKRKEDGESVVSDPKEYLEFTLRDGREGITGAFVWSDSPEGHKFWSELNRKWLKQIK